MTSSRRSACPTRCASTGRIGWVLEVPDERASRDARPDFTRLAEFDLAVAHRTPTTPPYDFVSRCFGPKFGIDEDPVTGSAHCALGPTGRSDSGRTS